MRSPEHDEILASGNMAREVRRVGETVRRPTGPWTPAVHHLLRHLEHVGFRGVPRALGTDEQAHDILSFIPGDVVHPRVVDHTDLARVARLIREFHNMTASFVEPADARWQKIGRDPSGVDELICHNDLAPWNLIVSEQNWAFIDWDLAAPGGGGCGISHCRRAPSCRCGWSNPRTCAAITRFVRRMGCRWLTSTSSSTSSSSEPNKTLVENADREPFATLVRDGHADSWRRVFEYVQQHNALWRGQLPPLQ